MDISYRKEWGLWWPDWDEKAEKNHAYILKHLPTMDFAISQSRKGLCIQAGGHVGLWPIELSKHFKIVETFEPEPDLFDCLRENFGSINLIDNGNLRLGYSSCALNDIDCNIRLKRSTSSGSNKIDSIHGDFSVRGITIDSLNLSCCDAIFLDIEGHEIFALRGASETIRKFRPVVQVEELDGGDNSVNTVMTELHGYRRHPEKQGKDVVYLPC